MGEAWWKWISRIFGLGATGYVLVVTRGVVSPSTGVLLAGLLGFGALVETRRRNGD